MAELLRLIKLVHFLSSENHINLDLNKIVPCGLELNQYDIDKDKIRMIYTFVLLKPVKLFSYFLIWQLNLISCILCQRNFYFSDIRRHITSEDSV